MKKEPYFETRAVKTTSTITKSLHISASIFWVFFLTYEHISNESLMTKTIVIPRSQSKLKAKTSRPLEAQENAGDQTEKGLSFASDWSRRWSEFFKTNHRAK